MRRLAAGLLAVGLATPALAIVHRDDRADEPHRTLGERFPAVGEVMPAGTGTLVAPRFVLTAAHVARGRGGASGVVLGGESYRVVRVIVHPQGEALREGQPPEVDLALLELERAVVGIPALQLYRGGEERGRTAILVGVGDYGPAGQPLAPSDRRRRAATNQVSHAGPLRLFFRFDAPPAGTDLEGVSAPGDSGGPALLEEGGRALVAGVSSASSGAPGRYGLTDVYVRVSRHLDWLESILSRDESSTPPLSYPTKRRSASTGK
jgi:hypothetical protein